MSTPKSIDIRSASTGILDLPADWHGLATPGIDSIRLVWSELRSNLAPEAIQGFIERQGREWAIETGVIEGLYQLDRGVTATLIERGFQAAILEHGSTDRPRDYVLQLLRDQKDCLDGLFDFVAQRWPLTRGYIHELHAALLRGQPETEAIDSQGRPARVQVLRGQYKRLPNFPSRDGQVFRYCPPEQTASEMDRLLEMHQRHETDSVPPEVSAAWLHHRFSQIHPYQDGNGRVARTLASLILIRDGLFPLVVTRDDKSPYLSGLEAADQGDLTPFVRLISRLQRAQFRRALAISEASGDESDAKKRLVETITRRATQNATRYASVFPLARDLEERLTGSLMKAANELQSMLQLLDPAAEAVVDRSEETTGHYFRNRIEQIARSQGYHPDPNPYRSWLRIRMRWSRQAQLVFCLHSTGAQFAGVLTCTAFLEFRDEDDGGAQTTLCPVAEEPFDFFFNQRLEEIAPAFDGWREGVLSSAFTRLGNDL